MNRDEIIAANPIAEFLRSRGVDLKGDGSVLKARQCALAIHRKDHWCVTVDPGKALWHCNDCDKGGTVIDWLMGAENLSVKDAMSKLGGNGNGGFKKAEPIEVAWYDYTDENGGFLFQVVRFVPKDFRQRHKQGNGWVWDMRGVRRVLYRLPEVVRGDTVIVVEGEKDADNLSKLGFVATSNPMGAKNWLDGYSDLLTGKIVYVWPDQDSKGLDHADLVEKSLAGKAKEVYRVNVKPKDASDFIALDPATAKTRVDEAISAAKQLHLIDIVPIKSFPDLELEYQEHVKRAAVTCLDLSKWLPSLKCIRPIVPGELVSILANTGVGKTAILQNIAIKAEPIPTLIFELELPGSLLFERFIQIDQGFTGEQIFRSYKDEAPLTWGRLHVMHLFFCTLSRIGGPDIERIINKAELKMGKRPSLVMIDYIGLMSSHGSSRYERVSEIAESLKVIAKTTETIVIFASQIARKGKDNDQGEISLHEAKDSGSIENSSGLVIGAWREGEYGERMILKILKNTKGLAGGKKVVCNFDGPTLRITEQSPISPSDIPPSRTHADA